MHKPHSLTIHADGMGAAVHIPDIISENLSNNATLEAAVPTHDKYPTHISLMGHALDKQLETYAVEDMLGAIGVGGLCIKTATNPGVLLNLAKFDECGDITAGSVHRSLKILLGIMFPRQLTVEHRGNARLTVGVAIVKKDANDAIIISDVLALPTIAIASKRWTLGTCKVGNVALSNFTRLTIDFGFRVELRGVQSEIYDRYVEIKETAPTIELTGIDPTWFGSGGVPIGGLACTHANTIFFLRKRDSDGNGFVADATAEHLKFTANGVAIITSASSSNENRFAETTLRITTRKDSGGNAPITYTGAIAIT